MLLDSTSSATTTTGSGQAATDKKKLDTDLNRFLTLLVTQLQHQDPLQPLDANQFTSQLVQFAGVEQQINQNANLEKLLAGQQNGQLASMVGYIGKTVEATGNAVPLQGGAALATYTLPEAAAQTTLTVRDASGRVVFTDSGQTDAGRHTFSWNGKGSDGRQRADGVYTLEVSARDRDGNALQAAQTVLGQVSGVSSGDAGPLLDLGAAQVKMENVLSIIDLTAS